MEFTRRGILFVISGPSGVGKGTIKRALLSRMTDINLSVSVTTRLPRDGEIEGKHYFFVDQSKFDAMIQQNQFLEWAEVYSNCYGTPRSFVVDNLDRGQDVLLEIDIQGALQVKKSMPTGVFIFISPPNMEELASRLLSRGQDSKASIDLRLAASKDELKRIECYDYLIINDDIEEALEKTMAIIMAERCRVENIDLR
ncbi:MAG: guanylate kinase [Syntrophomonadaceae bacterium]|nr:guanylate kinase [Syntrophomonadaceae bacterium]